MPGEEYYKGEGLKQRRPVIPSERSDEGSHKYSSINVNRDISHTLDMTEHSINLTPPSLRLIPTLHVNRLN